MALAADAQRERTVGVLRRAYIEGRLQTEEFTERAGRALEARTTGELRALVRDLPWLGDVVAGARDIAMRVALLAALGFFWTVASLVLLIAFVVALLAGGMSGSESLVFPLAWVGLTWAVWRAARR
jgi:DUF1707 SHOCT-like domain